MRVYELLVIIGFMFYIAGYFVKTFFIPIFLLLFLISQLVALIFYILESREEQIKQRINYNRNKFITETLINSYVILTEINNKLDNKTK